VIDNCLIERNNRNEQMAGIDLEPDEGLAVTDNKLVGNVSSSQNVGLQLYSYSRSAAVISNNAICSNSASGNRSAGIWDHNGTADIFVDNRTSGNGTNFSVDGSAKIGSAFASFCTVSSLPGQTPTHTHADAWVRHADANSHAYADEHPGHAHGFDEATRAVGDLDG
jgi:hypothetical protein